MDKNIKTRIIIADCFPIILEGLAAVINELPGYDLVQKLTTSADLWSAVKKNQPDIIITDISFQKPAGIDIIKRIKQEYPAIGIITFIFQSDTDKFLELASAEVDGYLLKDVNKNEITRALNAVEKGKSYQCRRFHKILLDIVKKQNNQKLHPELKIHLTEREKQVVKLICQGYQSKAIADKLHLTTRTIESYRNNIMKKMKVKNAPALVKFALKNALD